MEKLIITVAVCGSAPMKTQNPGVPYSPDEIAAEALRSWQAGASIAHIHVRDPETGKPAFSRDLFSEVLDRIRAGSDMLVNLTTSGFNIKGQDVGRQRLIPVELGPDLCSLDVGSLNFRDGRVFENPPAWVELAAQKMREAGVKPEIEVFDMGHIRQAKDLVSRGLVDDPPYFQLCLGIPWGIDGTLDSLVEMRRRLPKGAQWSALGAGPLQLPLTTHALLMGGHVRVGFEDNLYLERGVKADSNARFVERVVRLAGLLQREVASPAEARALLKLAPR
ncbi:MAG: 3-keto-5-aminohexanoate cleavage protein [Deltaproteobacteria bacterium]|nr:3-keto-5-aminohexanoate cleavage protein [Deltaproteobacteria bacterium]